MLVNKFEDAPRKGSGFTYRGGETCFNCHQPVWTGNAIHWHGSDERNEVTNLMLHPACAVELTALLLNDIRHAMLKPARGGA
jgi:hypothetical protein